ncbi:unnamed protein product [Arabidopsis halleri]
MGSWEDHVGERRSIGSSPPAKFAEAEMSSNGLAALSRELHKSIPPQYSFPNPNY